MSVHPRSTIWGSVALLLAALLPRLWMPVDFLTVDEAYHWFERVSRFHAAIQSGQYAGTFQIGHPGVTTMWLGSLGLEIYSQLVQLGWRGGTLATQHQLIRMPLAIVASLAIAGSYRLLLRLVDRRVALLGALLWASEPFLIAHAQLLHVDSLMASFTTLAILMALVALRGDGAPVSYRWLVGSAICFGLAMLTKSPAALVAPTVAALMLYTWRERGAPGRALAVAWGVWGGVALLVWVLLYPAVWVIPGEVIYSVVNEALQNGSTPHGWGNYFAGRAVDNPGPAFYLAALALRLTPWALAGVPLGLVALRAPGRAGRVAVATLALYSATFLIVMTLLAKKFDRYALPAIPALMIISAFGLLWAWDQIAGRVAPLRRAGGAARALGLAALIANVGLAAPYPIAYYSPLLGGGAAATWVLPVGWGEGLEQAGAFIRAQPDGCARPVAVFYGPVMRPYVCNRVVSLSTLNDPDPEAGYAVLYIDQIQRAIYSEETARLLASPPLHTVQINGIDYAHIYQLKRPLASDSDVLFGSSIHLVGYEGASEITAGGVVTLTLEWQKIALDDVDYMLFVHLYDSEGRRVGQSDLVLGGAENPVGTWGLQRYQLQEVAIPLADPGARPTWAAIGIYDPASTLRAPLTGPPPPEGAPDVGGNAFVVRLDTLLHSTQPTGGL